MTYTYGQVRDIIFYLLWNMAERGADLDMVIESIWDMRRMEIFSTHKKNQDLLNQSRVAFYQVYDMHFEKYAKSVHESASSVWHEKIDAYKKKLKEEFERQESENE